MEQNDKDEWDDLGPFEVKMGLEGAVAHEFGFAEMLTDDFGQVQGAFQISDTIEVLQPTAKDKWVARLARSLSSPLIAGMLLFAAMFFLSAELSSPGIGVGGLLSACCILLFFWSNYLEGSADWLEIILFVFGVVLILVEVLVLPGFGIFGVLGFLMTVSSIVLAVQDFSFPTTSEEIRQLPYSMGMLACGLFGFLAAFAIVPRILPYVPYFNAVILQPPGKDNETVAPADLHRRESLVSYEYLVGKRGTSMTDLRPAGKVQIDNEVHNVVTDGRLIEKGELVIVESVQGSRIVVKTLG